ncbi:hypothetical protein [Lysinibacillus fusiformis]
MNIADRSEGIADREVNIADRSEGNADREVNIADREVNITIEVKEGR